MIKFDYMSQNRFFSNKLINNIKKLLYEDENKLFGIRKSLEKDFAKFIGTNHAFYTNSGTQASKLSLALSAKKGQEVVLPILSYPSVVLEAIKLGLKPIFIDIKKDLTIDETKIGDKITKESQIILPTHMFGHVCNIKEIMKIAQGQNMSLIEDCCQAHGSKFNDKLVGSFGNINFFSFSYHKNISGMDGGGALTFNDTNIFSKLNNFKQFKKQDPLIFKTLSLHQNISISDLATLKIKIEYIKLIIQDKLRMQKIYFDELSNLKNIDIILDEKKSYSIRQIFVITSKNRNKLFSTLTKKKFMVKVPEINYEVYLPLNKLKLFSYLTKGKYPLADEYTQKTIFLPLQSFIKKETILKLCNEIKKFDRKN